MSQVHLPDTLRQQIEAAGVTGSGVEIKYDAIA